MLNWIKRLFAWEEVKQLEEKANEEAISQTQNLKAENVSRADVLVSPQPKFWRYHLDVYNKNNIAILNLSNDANPYWLMKIYMWYLIRESPKYSAEYKNGKTILLRENISRVVYWKEEVAG